MSAALIIYGSTTGNTQYTAEVIDKVLKEKGFNTALMDVADASLDELKKDFELILLGSSTWGDEDIELQEDFEPFYESMANGVSLTDKKLAIFGCGDSSYEHFCGAVDAIEERVQELGAEVVVDSLKIDGDPEEPEIRQWAEDLPDKA